MYQAFGLNIESEVCLSGRETGKQPVDVRISYGPVVKPWPANSEERRMYVREFNGDIYIVWYSESGIEQRILVQAGKEIIVDAGEEPENPIIKQAIQGLGLGLLLHQRERYVLHASAVKLYGETIVFIGFKGAGKSTTASAFFAKGYSLVTDDVLAIDLPDNDPRAYAHPGIPSIKLWPDSVKASLGRDPENVPRLFNQEEKRLLSLSERFVETPSPIRCVYVLDFFDEVRDSPSISQLTGRESCVELIRHSYGIRMMGPGGRNKSHFVQTTELLKRVPLFRLSRNRSLDDIPLLVKSIEEHDL